MNYVNIQEIFTIKFLVRFKSLFSLLINNIYLDLQSVHTSPGFQLKDIFHEKIVIVYLWTFSDIHSSHMMSKLIGVDKHYSTAGVSIHNFP
jgi:hypothetical protein